MTAPIIAIERVSKRFVRRPGLAERAAGLLTGGARAATVQALDDVSFSPAEREVVGLVGE